MSRKLLATLPSPASQPLIRRHHLLPGLRLLNTTTFDASICLPRPLLHFIQTANPYEFPSQPLQHPLSGFAAMSASRFGLRAAHQTFRPSAFTPNARFAQRRFQSTTADAAAAAAKGESSGFSKFWNSSVGPKTVHFWAPIMKWGVVIAGASDFARPAKDLSISQNAALMATGAIWTRWCFVIKPRNVFLASVNFLLFCVGATQVGRVLLYQQSLKGDSVSSEAGSLAKEEGRDLQAAAKKAENAMKQ